MVTYTLAQMLIIDALFDQNPQRGLCRTVGGRRKAWVKIYLPR